MNEETDIKVKELIVHILDINMHMPILSDQLHPEDEEVYEFIEKHILKILKDDNLKAAKFNEDNNIIKNLCTGLVYNLETFVPSTFDIANILFGLMQKHVDIPSADLVCTIFEYNGIQYAGILKFNYKSSYIHYVNAGQAGKVNSIIKQKTALPGEGQKVDECALINLRDLSVKLIEKMYEIDGEKQFYFSNLFLDCTSDISNKQKAKIFKKASEDFNKKYFEEDYNKSNEIKKAVVECLEKKEVIDVEEVAECVFRQNPEMRKTYVEHIEKSGLPEKTINVSERLVEKDFKRQKFKTDTGIEINLPVEFCSDNQKIEFINNIDGTISILIKNVGKLVNL